MATPNRSARFDEALARLADAQHGVVSRAQLDDLGLGRTAVADRVRRGRLVRLHRGVYAVGHRRLHRNGHWMAAVLAVGPCSALSHRDAAALHGLRRPHDGRIDVTTMRDRESNSSVAVHRTAWLTANDVTTVAGIQVTTVARTLVDLAEVVSGGQLARALSEAERLMLVDVRDIVRVLGQTRGRRGPGHRRMRTALDDHAAQGVQMTRSDLERRFFDLVAGAGLPAPTMNATVEGVEVDALWRSRRFVVEIDSWLYHRTRADFERDHDKRSALEAAGWRVISFSDRQVLEHPEQVLARLRRIITTGRPDLSGPGSE